MRLMTAHERFETLLNQHQIAFDSQPVTDVLVDTSGRKWSLSEDDLTLSDGAVSLPRDVAHRAFWFAWYAQYPETLLLGAGR